MAIAAYRCPAGYGTSGVKLPVCECFGRQLGGDPRADEERGGRLLGFDSSLGFPGEGPGPRGGIGVKEVLFGTVNSTAWSSFVGAGLMAGSSGEGVACWAVQETKLRKSDVNKAGSLADAKGWGADFEPARVTERDGLSSGVAVLWDRQVCGRELGKPMERSGRGRWCAGELLVGQLPVTVASFYGNTYDEVETLSLIHI